MSFDLLRYREHKELGLIKVEKQDNQTKFICTQYDRFTGQKLDDVIVLVTDEMIQQIKNQRTMAERVVEECKAVLQDIAVDAS